MVGWKELCWLPEQELAVRDLAEINLACARDLPGTELIKFDLCFQRMDYMTDCVRRATEKMLPQFRRRRYDYNNSEPYFRALCLITVLQRDLGVRYNPAKIPDDEPFDTADSFIHGILQGPGGTCATLPVLYVAIGRRLGYPMKLVCAYGGAANHLFARWNQTGGEQFNIEASDQGLRCPPDDYYRTGRYAVTPELESAGNFLQSMTPRQELANFLANRAHVWEDHQNLRQAVDSWCWAAALDPNNELIVKTLKLRFNDWQRQVKARMPAGFPDVYQEVAQRMYASSLPLNMERDVTCVQAIENLLNTPELEERWWGKMRQGAPVPNAPVKVTVRSAPDRTEVGLRFDPAT